ncbi:GPI transamidase component PIG-T [Coemansia spiralis]|nr:GPI transamidase component PIG-T [Coemansia spiralis]
MLVSPQQSISTVLLASFYLLADSMSFGEAMRADSVSHYRSSSNSETFTEDLLVKPLHDGKVLLHFEFRVQQLSAEASSSQHHYHLFPRQIGEIAKQNGVDELHLSFTQGGWRQDTWGSPPVNSQGVGAEIIARINGTEDGSSGSKWKGLTNALSGVFCASLNFIDEGNTAMPQLTFTTQNTKRDGVRAGQDNSAATNILRHGYLPRENVCTENLTPWIKQLPCQAKSGIGALLNPYRLFNMHFHSMGISLEPSIEGEIGSNRKTLNYKQYISVVLDPHTFNLDKSWTLSELMDRDLYGACQVSTKSTVRVIMPDSGLKVLPKPATTMRLAGDQVSVFDIQKQNISDIEFEFTKVAANVQTAATQQPTISAHRYVNGHGGSSGGVVTEIINRSSQPMDIIFLDTLPWYLRVYSHTLDIEATTADGQVKKLTPTKILFTPAIDRGRPSSIELSLSVPENTRTTLRYSFDKGFLKYTEHPPDANRGFNIGPAIITYQQSADRVDVKESLFCALQRPYSNNTKNCTVRIHTELFLASLPTPDFSMPYNVITFTCTVLALFFGRIFNLLTRDFAVLKEDND